MRTAPHPAAAPGLPVAGPNPLLEAFDAPFGLPPFAAVRAEHYAPALERAMREHREEIARIAGAGAAPTFENTVAALDRAGRLYSRVSLVFHNLVASESSPELRAVERELMPKLAAHEQAITTDAALFARIDALHGSREALGLDAESRRLLERVHLDFTLAGATLDVKARARAAVIVERLAALFTTFRQNVLHDEATRGLELHDARDLAGVPPSVRATAREAARERGMADGWFVSMSRSIVVPFLACAERRDLRERAFRLWTSRGEHAGENDNRPVAREILALRHELARLHGHATYAHYALVDRMAGTPAAAAALLERAWVPARARALEERDELAALARARGEPDGIEPWDWRYYAEKLREARYALDEEALKPYFPLEQMVEAAFECAHRLFGVTFVPRPDLAAYHPDVRTYEVRGADGRMVALFLADNFIRATKRGGAWMSCYRMQSRASGEVLPIVVNNNNFAKAPPGESTLLSQDDVRTLFHEFGHGLHGMLSQVTWERLSGTNVLADFVELPSQIYEHWAFEPEVLKRHARHHRTGEPMPDALIERLRDARRFNQGFQTVEYVSSALVDLALHGLADPGAIDIAAFEREALARIGMPREIVMRHRLPHFDHLFGGNGYAAGYYVYLWAEVLDADGYRAFAEAGDCFDPKVAARLHRYIYASGGSLEPAAAYRAFRGRDPAVEPMLADRGLIDEAVPG